MLSAEFSPFSLSLNVSHLVTYKANDMNMAVMEFDNLALFFAMYVLYTQQ